MLDYLPEIPPSNLFLDVKFTLKGNQFSLLRLLKKRNIHYGRTDKKLLPLLFELKIGMNTFRDRAQVDNERNNHQKFIQSN